MLKSTDEWASTTPDNMGGCGRRPSAIRTHQALLEGRHSLYQGLWRAAQPAHLRQQRPHPTASTRLICVGFR